MEIKQHIELIDHLESVLKTAKETLVENEGWFKDNFNGHVFWCRDEDAISDIDTVIEIIEGEL